MNRLSHMQVPRLVFAWVIVAGGAGLARAHEDHPTKASPKKVPVAKAEDTYRPGLLPDRIILTWTGDPATTQAVTWRTSIEIDEACAEIAVAESGPGFPLKARRIPATTQTLETDIYSAHCHTVEFTELTPGTKYAYRVGDGQNWSEWFHFQTASQGAEPFSFVYFGDAQNDVRSLWSRVIREAYRDAPRARFMIHAGDLINSAERDVEWGEWFGAGHWLNAMVPSVPVPGNHEQAKAPDGTRRLSRHWRPQFALPVDGPPGLEESCYSFVYQNVRVVGLNSNEQLDVQAAWLDRLLAENKARWVVCTFHHPIFSTGSNRDNPTLRNAWKPVFDKYHVDLVLTGHDHSYGRTGIETPRALPETTGNVPTGLSKVDERTGTIYVVSVSGPKMYKLDRKPFMVRAAEDTQLYQIIHVDGDTLRYEARTAIGDLYDAFALQKRAGQVNELMDGNSLPKERLRPTAPAAAGGQK